MLEYDEYLERAIAKWEPDDKTLRVIDVFDKEKKQIAEILDQIYQKARVSNDDEILESGPSIAVWKTHKTLFDRYVKPLAESMEETGRLPFDLQVLGIPWADGRGHAGQMDSLAVLELILKSEKRSTNRRRVPEANQTKQTRRQRLSRDLLRALRHWVDSTFPRAVRDELSNPKLRVIVAREALLVYHHWLSQLPGPKGEEPGTLLDAARQWNGWYQHTNVIDSLIPFNSELSRTYQLLKQIEDSGNIPATLWLAVFSKMLHCSVYRAEFDAASGENADEDTDQRISYERAYDALFERLSLVIESLRIANFAQADVRREAHVNVLSEALHNRQEYSEDLALMGKDMIGRPPGGEDARNNQRYWLWGKDTWETILAFVDQHPQAGDQPEGGQDITKRLVNDWRLAVAIFGQPLAKPKARPDSAREQTLSFETVCKQLRSLVGRSRIVTAAHEAMLIVSSDPKDDEPDPLAVGVDPEWERLWQQRLDRLSGKPCTEQWEDEEFRMHDAPECFDYFKTWKQRDSPTAYAKLEQDGKLEKAYQDWRKGVLARSWCQFWKDMEDKA